MTRAAAGLALVFGLGSTSGAGPSLAEGVGEEEVIGAGRATAVRVLTQENVPAGSGFFLDNQHVATCFHVVATKWSAKIEKGAVQDVQFELAPGIRVVAPTGEGLNAEVDSLPTVARREPLLFDFAILRLSQPYGGKLPPIRFYAEGSTLRVGDPILFTGYPLDAPFMLTRRGWLAGIFAPEGILGLQAPINKGDSGSALMAADGTVIGIISMRLGGIGKGLQELRQQIDAGAAMGSAKIMGIDPLQATKRVIETMDLTISTGIGYARSTIYMDKYRKGPAR